MLITASRSSWLSIWYHIDIEYSAHFISILLCLSGGLCWWRRIGYDTERLQIRHIQNQPRTRPPGRHELRVRHTACTQRWPVQGFQGQYVFLMMDRKAYKWCKGSTLFYIFLGNSVWNILPIMLFYSKQNKGSLNAKRFQI